MKRSPVQCMSGWFSRAIATIIFCLCLVGPALAAEPYPQKFDLICHGTARQVFQPYPPVHGLGLAHAKGPLSVHDHFIVDLSSMNFCEDQYCSGGGHRKLANMDNDRIFFEDKIGLHESVDLRTLKYVMQIEQDEGIIEATRGICRFAPFSGFRW